LKEHLALAVVVVLGEPAIYEIVNDTTATVSNPHAGELRQSFLPVLLEQFVVFDRRSGQVLVRLRREQETARQAATKAEEGVPKVQSPAAGGGSEIVLSPDLGARGAASGPGQLSDAQIMSDTQGVDFNPYSQRVVFEIRRAWISVMPEVARAGKRGKVVLQFEILKDGVVPKVLLITSSQSEPLGRAAYAGVTASSPFPPLPPEFKGPMLRLQLGFLYNTPLRKLLFKLMINLRGGDKL